MKAKVKYVLSTSLEPRTIRTVEIPCYDVSDDSLGEAKKEMKKDADLLLVNPQWVGDRTIFGGHYKGDGGECIILE